MGPHLQHEDERHRLGVSTRGPWPRKCGRPCSRGPWGGPAKRRRARHGAAMGREHKCGANEQRRERP